MLVQGQTFRLCYFLNVNGAGETTVNLNFPILFQERPALSCAGELAEGSVLQAGSFPWCSAMVASWVTEERNGQTYYTGAKVAVVVGGPSRQKSIVHMNVEGKALQSPVRS